MARDSASSHDRDAITLDGAHFYVDLVFYHRLLRCFVVIDLKLGELTHQDLGQLQMYVNYFDRFHRAEHENPTVGVVLCSEKNDAIVEITLPKDNEQILAARYQLHLPTAEELRDELARERPAAERVLSAASDDDSKRLSGYESAICVRASEGIRSDPEGAVVRLGSSPIARYGPG